MMGSCDICIVIVFLYVGAVKMTTETPFELSALAREIRKANSKYDEYQDDYKCVAEWCEDVSFFVNVDKIDWEEMEKALGETSILGRAFLEDVYGQRKKLLDKQEAAAQLSYDEFKARITTLLVENEELKKCSTIPSDGVRNALKMITTPSALRAGMNAYYKIKSDGEDPDPANPEKEVDEGDQGAHCKELGQVAFLGLKALLTDLTPKEQPTDETTIQDSTIVIPSVVIPDEIFTENTMFLKGSLQSFAKLFASVQPAIRAELMGRFKKVMKEIVSCFALYRLPVCVVEGESPVYPGRFIPAVALKPFLQMCDLQLASFTVYPQ